MVVAYYQLSVFDGQCAPQSLLSGTPVVCLSRLGKPTREGQHQRHDMLGDRAGIDTPGAREPHAVLLERLARDLVGAGADRLDEAQPLRTQQDIVAPEPRDHQHIAPVRCSLQPVTRAMVKD